MIKVVKVIIVVQMSYLTLSACAHTSSLENRFIQNRKIIVVFNVYHGTTIICNNNFSNLLLTSLRAGKLCKYCRAEYVGIELKLSPGT